jgi:hypothetical protein
VAHAGEHLLSRLRDRVLALDEQCTWALFVMIDSMRRLLGQIERNRVEGDENHAPVIRWLDRLAGVAPAAPARPLLQPPPPPRAHTRPPEPSRPAPIPRDRPNR